MLFLLPQLNRQIWILAFGRLILNIGTGLTVFYTPIFFVNQVGLSSTLVGTALATASLSGVFGRFLGGSLADSRGRKPTLLLSAAVSIIANLIFAFTVNFPTLIIANLFRGLGMGLYWPPIEAAVADLTTLERRNEAFALSRLADSIGIGIGTILAGNWIAKFNDSYQILFLFEALAFGLFFLLIYLMISETYIETKEQQQEKKQEQVNTKKFKQSKKRWTELKSLPKFSKNWSIAFSDRSLIIFLLANILFTTYLALYNTAIPLYFKNSLGENSFSETTIGNLFSFSVFLTALLQLPIARWLNRFVPSRALMLCFFFWGLGFFFISVTGIVTSNSLIAAIIALTIMSIAVAIYNPSASALTMDLSPVNLRGIYFSINAQCWAIGFFIGPMLGGWALDRSDVFVKGFWLGTAASMAAGIVILKYLNNNQQ